jgi:hypothetical protein
MPAPIPTATDRARPAYVVVTVTILPFTRHPPAAGARCR